MNQSNASTAMNKPYGTSVLIHVQKKDGYKSQAMFFYCTGSIPNMRSRAGRGAGADCAPHKASRACALSLASRFSRPHECGTSHFHECDIRLDYKNMCLSHVLWLQKVHHSMRYDVKESCRELARSDKDSLVHHQEIHEPIHIHVCGHMCLDGSCCSPSHHLHDTSSLAHHVTKSNNKKRRKRKIVVLKCVEKLSDIWIRDSGCTSHTTIDKNLLWDHEVTRLN
ncbi:hypothetical protein DERF_009172 [Dermatophagoides farinae]|uniref:Uncharacterized protein n=1 Tax=Dermatophagoides farinae TaxID=6954 RepID=A0A922HTG6_DERFA|nr:hypothetical protein DERF_009172 [Dermatophagoides farinae]